MSRSSARPDRQLLVDVSCLAAFRQGTGIHRVARNITREYLRNAPAGFAVLPVVSVGERLVHASQVARLLGSQVAADSYPIPVNPRPHDVYLGLGFPVHDHYDLFYRRICERGVTVHSVVFDLIPLRYPRWFQADVRTRFRCWLTATLGAAASIACISRTVADDLWSWIRDHPPARHLPLRINYFHPSAEMEPNTPYMGTPESAEAVFRAMAERPSILMVATVCANKRQSQVYDATKLLWQEGRDLNLVLVGGIMNDVSELATELLATEQRGKRLFHLSRVTDDMLRRLYSSATVLILASETEGFGLPAAEAAQHGLPLILRDLPIFRELAGEHAFYFSGTSAESLAQAMRDWFELRSRGRVPSSSNMKQTTWAESADALANTFLHRDAYLVWTPRGEASGSAAHDGCRNQAESASPSSDDEKTGVTAESIVWTYRLFFGREPESDEAIELHRSAYRDIPSLTRAIFLAP